MSFGYSDESFLIKKIRLRQNSRNSPIFWMSSYIQNSKNLGIEYPNSHSSAQQSDNCWSAPQWSIYLRIFSIQKVRRKLAFEKGVTAFTCYAKMVEYFFINERHQNQAVKKEILLAQELMFFFPAHIKGIERCQLCIKRGMKCVFYGLGMG